MVLRDDRELLSRLAQVNGDVPGLALRLMNGELPADEQRAFAHRLAGVAEALVAHADRRDQPVIDGPAAGVRASCASATAARTVQSANPDYGRPTDKTVRPEGAMR